MDKKTKDRLRAPGVKLARDNRDNNRQVNVAVALYNAMEGGATIQELAAKLGGEDEVHTEAVRSALRRLRRDGLATRGGFDPDTGHVTFVLTAEGRRWAKAKLSG